MNICIGGPWHGSKRLAPRKYEKYFKVKDKSLNSVSIYFKKSVKAGDAIYDFWVCEEISDLEINELTKNYIHRDFTFIS